MLCPRCGWTNVDGSLRCANCQADLAQPMAPQALQPTLGVPSYTAWSVIVTTLSVLLCNPAALVLGIIAIAKSSSASRRAEAGDRSGALGDANAAMVLDIVGSALLAVGLLLAIPFWIGFLASLASHNARG